MIKITILHQFVLRGVHEYLAVKPTGKGLFIHEF